jgi:hypothetical protein
MMFRYMERMHLSYAQALNTPWSEINRAFYIWSLDSERAKLETERQQAL